MTGWRGWSSCAGRCTPWSGTWLGSRVAAAAARSRNSRGQCVVGRRRRTRCWRLPRTCRGTRRCWPRSCGCTARARRGRGSWWRSCARACWRQVRAVYHVPAALHARSAGFACAHRTRTPASLHRREAAAGAAPGGRRHARCDAPPRAGLWPGAAAPPRGAVRRPGRGAVRGLDAGGDAFRGLGRRRPPRLARQRGVWAGQRRAGQRRRAAVPLVGPGAGAGGAGGAGGGQGAGLHAGGGGAGAAATEGVGAVARGGRRRGWAASTAGVAEGWRHGPGVTRCALLSASRCVACAC